jgi:hypothetical protein
MEEVWNEVWLKAPEEEQDAFREEHGLQVVVVHQSVAGAPLVLSSGPKKPVLEIDTGNSNAHQVAQPVDQRLPSNVGAIRNTNIVVENKFGTSKAALSLAQVKAAPSLAQAKAAGQQKASESKSADDKDKKAAAPADKKESARQFSYARALGNNSGV